MVPVKRPRTFERKPPTASLPAVVPSHPGTSYNPAFADHQNLLDAAVEVELGKEKKRENVIEQLSYPVELDELPEDHEVAAIEDGSDEEDEDESEPAMIADSKRTDGIPMSQTEKNKRKRREKHVEEEEKQRLRKKQRGEIAK